MRYHPPLGVSDPDAPWLNGVPGQQRGSAVDSKAIEYPMREIVNVITSAGLTPTDENLAQLTEAIGRLIAAKVPEVLAELTKDMRSYHICGVYTDDDWLTAPPGFQPATGGVIQNAMTFCPRAWEYLQTAEGQQLRISESAWQAARAAAPWNGVGGVKKFVQDTSAGTIRLPDLRGMYKEAAGYDGLGVAGVAGEQMRQVAGDARGLEGGTAGAFDQPEQEPWFRFFSNASGDVAVKYFRMRASLVAPIGPAFAPRRWGALACVYLGLPAS